jgi:nickel/cobalt exporter
VARDEIIRLVDGTMRSKPRIHRTRALLVALLLALLPALGTAAPAQAHPLDMFFFAHEVYLTPEKFEVHTTIRPGPLTALSEWYQLDADLDGEVSPREVTEWAEARIDAFSLALAGAGELPLTMISVGWPSSAESVQLGEESFRFAARAEWPAALGTGSAARRLELHFQYQEARSINWFYLHGEEGIAFATPDQDNGRLSVELRAASGVFSPAVGLRYWDSGSPVVGSPREDSPAGPAGNRSTAAILTELVRDENPTAAFYLGAFFITLLLGSIHALTPGHGKTLTAAYLIGERGTVSHAFALGGIVTATHTGSVLVFGLLTLAVSQFLVPADLFPYLELLSGLLIVVLAVGLILPRWRGYRRVKRAREQASAPDRRPGSATAEGGVPANRIAVHQSIESRPYNGLLPGGNRWPAAASGPTRRLLVMLGVSGGLVPCPDAVAILLVAVAINRILLGLALVATFSLGMAAVLILIGLAVVRGRRWLGRFDAFSRVAPILPVISAGIILGMGLIITADTILRYGFPDTGRTGAALNPPPAASPPAFDISQAGLLYLAPDDHGLIQIHLQSPVGREPRRITGAPQGVSDYQLSPDGAHIGFASAGDEGSGIWVLPIPDGEAQLAVDCGEAYCRNVLWTPDGAHLLYERTEPNTVSAVPTLWAYGLEDGTTQTVFRDPQIPGYTASWSPDGDWLSYWSFPGSPTVELYNLRTGERDSISSQTGLAADWSPDGASLLLTDMFTSAERTVSHLFRYDLADKSLTDLSLRPDIEDFSGSWSPDGEWLAVIRREDTALTPAGTQIWLMRPDGGEAHPATSASLIFHSRLQWSPDGRYLLIQQHGLGIEDTQTEIWLLDIQTGEYAPLVENGFEPSWSS